MSKFKKLEEILNLAPMESIEDTTESTESVEQTIENEQLTIAAINNSIDLIDAALPMVRDLDASDAEMDAIATLATDTFTELVALSMNVEPRFSGTILQSASTILGHAVTAKIAKMDKKLKVIDLQLKKRKIDQQSEKLAEPPIDGAGVVMSRSSLLKMILEKNQEK